MADDELQTLLLILSVGARVQRTLDAGGGPVLSGTEFRLLSYLKKAPAGVRLSELAAMAQLTPSGLSRAVRALGERRLVTREPDGRDGRGAFVRLTGNGRARLDEAAAGVTEAASRLLRRLSVGQRKQLERLLGEIA